MRVLKFGGTSVANPERIRIVSSIILASAQEEPVVVVVSAFQGISSLLLKCAQMAAENNAEYLTVYQQISDRHLDTINQLIPKRQAALDKAIQQVLLELSEVLQGIFLLKELTLGALDHIASFGERLSANIIASYINQKFPAEYVDARQFIITDNNHTQASVLFEQTNDAIRLYYNKRNSKTPVIPVITGFIGSTVKGRTTTLGRNSSDYSAAIIGAALEASQVEIWTDVDGVYSADPHIVPTAFVVRRLSYAEAIELSYFGAKVLHPSTFAPLIEKQIPILIKNTFNPEFAGTLISHQTKHKKTWSAKSITVIDDITLLIWQGTGIADVSGTAERLFKSLRIENINIFLILEASPKHTICLAISHKDLEKARNAIQKEFYLELQHHYFHLEEKHTQSIVAIIGDDMKGLSPEISGKMFQLLGKMQINVNAIVHGASERNFSLVIDTHQRTRAVNFIHQAFFAKEKELMLIMVGVGNIGSAMLQQIVEQQAALLNRKIKVTVSAIANSKKMLVNPLGLNLENWRENLNQSSDNFDVTSLLQKLSENECCNVALIDCTASDDIVAAYPLFIQQGIHIISPNKRANVLPYDQYQTLMEQFDRHRSQFLCRTNVGAGLPILTVLEDLIACGDTIIKIEGIFSGTLSYLFNHYDGTVPFGELLKQTHELRMTEPDPREDLSGIDVARKLLILARHMGWKMELSDIPVESLVPTALQSGKFSDAFYTEYVKYEQPLKNRAQACKRNHSVLRYIGVLHKHTASAQLQEIPYDHPLALACESDNIIAFTTRRYHDNPLVIRGPGAGVEVTAMAVFSDMLKLLNYLPD